MLRHRNKFILGYLFVQYDKLSAASNAGYRSEVKNGPCLTPRIKT
jgi:hypothetical protein